MASLNDLKREISLARFSRSAIGYKASEVDLFIDGLQRKVLSAIDEHASLSAENEKLRNELETLKKAQESITRAIANSEKIAQASVIDAGVKSKYILQDASEKASIMIKTASEEYEKKIGEINKLNEEIKSFVNNCVKKFESQIQLMKSIPVVPVSPLNIKNFQVDDVAKQFAENSENSIIFSDKKDDNKDKKNEKNKYDGLQFGSDFKRF